MGFRAVLRTEQGEELRSLPRYHDQLVLWPERGSYPMLGHIDPHGDTVFNNLQMQTLEAELRHLLETGPGNDQKREFVEQLISLCVEGVRRPHRYLWLIGD